MTLKEKILKDRMNAMKEGNTNKKNVLSALIGELDRTTKDPSDAQVVNQVKKLIESNVECKNTEENQYLECYLPSMLSETELTDIIVNEITTHGYNSIKNMGSEQLI